MPCGDKYAHLIVASGGRSKAQPRGDSNFWGPSDVVAWEASVLWMRSLIVERLALLRQRDPELADRADLTAVETFAKLSKDALEITIAEGIVTLMQQRWGDLVYEFLEVMRAGTCALEEVDDLLDQAGAEIEPIPVPWPSSVPSGNTADGGATAAVAILTVVAVGGLAWWAWRRA